MGSGVLFGVQCRGGAGEAGGGAVAAAAAGGGAAGGKAAGGGSGWGSGQGSGSSRPPPLVGPVGSVLGRRLHVQWIVEEPG